MALYALPSITEERFASYLKENYTGSYAISPAFTTADYALPLILVKAGNFRQYEPGTHVYQGNCLVSVFTQVDDVADPLTTHDNTVATIYDLLADKVALSASVNATGGNFHLHNADMVSYEQEINQGENRQLVSLIELEIYAQTLEAS